MKVGDLVTPLYFLKGTLGIIIKIEVRGDMPIAWLLLENGDYRWFVLETLELACK